MSQFIESFFDTNPANFKLWTKRDVPPTINEADVIFKGPMLKMNRKNNKLKERFFVLTATHFYYLKSAKQDKVRGIMDVKWVRIEVIFEEAEKDRRFCFRFIKNMKYSDFFVADEKLAKEWRKHFCRVFIQSDFHVKFNAIKMIGKGSFARVYLAEDKETKQKFAVKAFSKEYLMSQSKGKESLINEIEIMQALRHPYIMSLEEVHESKNSIYLVLELLEGGELFNHISSKNKLTFQDVSRVMRCLLEALVYLSDRGVMHRDLKPENMILKDKEKLEFSQLKLVDFGLATFVNVDEYLFKRCGTPGYVAPEIINAPSDQNVHYTPKCDVFSAGIIFYILLTGKSPFSGKSFSEILNQNKACKIDYKRDKLKSFPHAIDLLQKMLEVSVEKRFSAAECLKHAFFKSGEPEKQLEIDIDTSLRNISKNRPMPDKKNSLVVRDAVINGETHTMNETGSDAGINSFRNVEKGAGPRANVKRESIYKYVLMKEGKEPGFDNVQDSMNSNDSENGE